MHFIEKPCVFIDLIFLRIKFTPHDEVSNAPQIYLFMKKPQRLLMSIFLTYFLLITFSSCQKDEDLFTQAIDEEIEETVQEENKDDNAVDEPDSDSDPILDDEVSYGVLAFPSAEGAGAYATGGRGGKVLFVTTLADSGEGSFRWAIQQNGPRTIVFNVSGEIELRSSIVLSGSEHSNLTIAGQTAPQGGITIKGAPLQFYNVQNIVIRYLRVRPFNSQGAGEGNDAITCMSCRYVIYDHLSVSGGGDETIDFWHFGGSQSGNVTVQRVLTGESQNGGLAGGEQTPDVWRTLTYFSSHHNLSIHGYNRMPSNAAGGTHEYVNNLIGNWKFKLISAECNARVNQINNYYKPGSTSNTSKGNGLNMLSVKSGHDVKVYASGNYYESMGFANQDNRDGWTITINGQAVSPPNPWESYFQSSPFSIEGVPITVTSASEAVSDVTGDVGANKYLKADGSYGTWQDDLDKEYISDFLNDTYTNCKGCSGFVWYDGGSYAYPNIPTNQRSSDYDSDMDGMADIWEMANFGTLNTGANDDADQDGYTNLEEFLNMVDR